MNYIVFDLEWNQSPDGKAHENKRLPFEIIEIGAVKLNENREIVDYFQRLIKPQVYHWIQDSIHEVIHVDYKDLADGAPFPEVIREFFAWCGEEYLFFTWGNQDLTELQRNMNFYNLLSLLKGPVSYYDVQKIYGLSYADGEHRALESAVEHLQIRKQLDFHRAMADAYYTACVLGRLEPDCIKEHPSLDVYQNPKSKREEVHLSFPLWDKYVTREFHAREKVIRDREVVTVRCPVCHCLAKRRVRWFMNNARVYYSLSSCREHGFIEGKIRIRRTETNRYFAVKKLMCVDGEEAERIRSKHAALRKKRAAAE